MYRSILSSRSKILLKIKDATFMSPTLPSIMNPIFISFPTQLHLCQSLSILIIILKSSRNPRSRLKRKWPKDQLITIMHIFSWEGTQLGTYFVKWHMCVLFLSLQTVLFNVHCTIVHSYFIFQLLSFLVKSTFRSFIMREIWPF